AAEAAVAAARELDSAPLEVRSLLLEVEALDALGRHEEASSSLSRAADLARESDDRRSLAALALTREDALAGGAAVELPVSFSEALQIFRTTGDREGEARVLVQEARRFMYLGEHLPEAGAKVDQALAIAREIHNRRLQAEALDALGTFAFLQGKMEDAEKAFGDAVDAAREARSYRYLLSALQNHAVALHVLRRLDTARTLYEEAAELGKRLGSRNGYGWMLANFGWLLLDLGDEEGAVGVFSEGLAVGEHTGSAELRGLCHKGLGAALRTLQGWESAVGHLEAAIELFEEAGQQEEADRLRVGFYETQAVNGEVEEAIQGLNRLASRYPLSAGAQTGVASRATLAETLRKAGRLEEALGLALELEATDLQRFPDERADVLLTLARAQAAAGRLSEAERRLRAFTDPNRRLGTPEQSLLARLFLGAVLRLRGQEDEGRAELVTVRREARRLGLDHLADSAERTLAGEPEMVRW
ncbi:MAG: hypothetical protein KDD47_28440, partial [Acidobacteria bacterium]|nr:hypothetical protein [Acidobacteriota bacterium]